jgi:hypothetical protein
LLKSVGVVAIGVPLPFFAIHKRVPSAIAYPTIFPPSVPTYTFNPSVMGAVEKVSLEGALTDQPIDPPGVNELIVEP